MSFLRIHLLFFSEIIVSYSLKNVTLLCRGLCKRQDGKYAQKRADFFVYQQTIIVRFITCTL